MRCYLPTELDLVAALARGRAVALGKAKGLDLVREKVAVLAEVFSASVLAFRRRARFISLSLSSPKKPARRNIRESAHWLLSSASMGGLAIYTCNQAWAWGSTKRLSKRSR